MTCSTVVNSTCWNALELEEKYVKNLCTRDNCEDSVYCDSFYSFKGTGLESLTVLKKTQSPQISQVCLLGRLSGVTHIYVVTSSRQTNLWSISLQLQTSQLIWESRIIFKKPQGKGRLT